MKQKHVLLLTSALLFLDATLVDGQGRIFSQHLGSRDPATEGFTQFTYYGSPQWGPGTNDAGTPAWPVRSSMSGTYYYQSVPAIVGSDWSAIVTEKVTSDPVGPVFWVQVDNGSSFFEIEFGIDSQGRATAEAHGASATPLAIIPGAGYHTLQLNYSGRTGLANFFADGVELFSGIQPAQGYSPDFLFGVAYQSPGDLAANWAQVSLQSVPEPSAGGLLFLVLAGWLLRRSARFRPQRSKFGRGR